MAEPLVISFAADTSRAQSAMQSLTAQLIGNMTSIGVAMQGGAANANNFGSAFGAVANNLQRAAAAVGQDVKNISTATANAATADRATLEGVVKAFTGAAVASNTAGTAVRTGLLSTTTAIQGVAAQIPSLQTLLGAFLAFEAAKLVFSGIATSIDEARKHVEDYTKIGKDADRAGVSPEYFQRVTLGAEKYGLTVQQATEALNRFRDASDVKIGEGKDGRTTSAVSDRLQQNVLAKNITGADKQAYENADGAEAKFKALLDIIQKLRDAGKDAAAFDLAGKFISPEFERQLRNGADAVNKLKAAIDTKSTTVAGIRIVGDDEVERANQLDAKAKSIADTFASALAPIAKDVSNAVLDTYEAFLSVESVIARVVTIAVDLYTKISNIVGAVREFVGSIPGIGKLITASNPVQFLKEYLDLGKKGLQAVGAIGPDADQPLVVPVRAGRKKDTSNNLPSLHAPRGRERSDTESLDAVETYINQLEKARDTAKAELDNVGKTNVERERAVALARAEAAAREDVKRGKRTDPALDDDERTRVLSAADATARYKDQQMDLEQQLRKNAEAARYFGETASNALADAIVDGKSFSSVLSGLVKQLEKGALQAIFTGQGPLAGILGTATASSAGSNAVGGLAGLVTGGGKGFSLAGLFSDPLPAHFAANGADVTAGQPVTVGEMGREMFVPKTDGRIMPIVAGQGGGAGGNTTIGDRIYNITPAGGVTPAQMTAALTRYDAELNRTFLARADIAKRRYG